MAASGGISVIGKGAVVEGFVERSVIWDGVEVRPGERLVDAIKAANDVTVFVR
jgi:ADP-glucose pyrophosphorylase